MLWLTKSGHATYQTKDLDLESVESRRKDKVCICTYDLSKGTQRHPNDKSKEQKGNKS